MDETKINETALFLPKQSSKHFTNERKKRVSLRQLSIRPHVGLKMNKKKREREKTITREEKEK